MSIKSNIRKILFLVLSVASAGTLLVLLIAAINKKNHMACKGVQITIKGIGSHYFLDKQEMMKIIAPDKRNLPKGRPLASFDLHGLEKMLLNNIWVKDANLFFDNNGNLRVIVTERVPVARIFTISGNSFYIDSSGKHLPLSEKTLAKLPVFTNCPADKGFLRGRDSLLMLQIRQLSHYLLEDSFWMAQIAQIDITANRTFEMIPVIGNHVIVFGDGTNYEQKFHRLRLFYQQVAIRVGFDKYSRIDVQYEKQIIGTKKMSAGKFDSLQVLKNIQKLVESSKEQSSDTVSTMVDNNIGLNAKPEPSLLVLRNQHQHVTITDSVNKILRSTNPSFMKSKLPKPGQISVRKSNPIENSKPKAVMRKID